MEKDAGSWNALSADNAKSNAQILRCSDGSLFSSSWWKIFPNPDKLRQSEEERRDKQRKRGGGTIWWRKVDEMVKEKGFPMNPVAPLH